MAKKHRKRKRRGGGLDKERNRIRGLIAASKSHEIIVGRRGKGAAKTPKERARTFQRSLAAILVRSRERLRSDEFSSFLSWLDGQTGTQLSVLNSDAALDSELVAEALKSHPLPLHKELLWVALRLSFRTRTLEHFVAQAKGLEWMYWQADWNSLQHQLNHIEQVFGRTLWVMEARIALQQEFSGLEAQKQVVRAERKLHPRGRWAHWTYMDASPLSSVDG